MKLYVSVIAAALFAFSLASCGGAGTPGEPGAIPAAHVVVPLANSVVITAVHANKPIPHLEVSLTRNQWPKGKLIAKGATGPQGRVTLLGNWTAKDIICAGGRYYTRSGFIERSKCAAPFPKALTLDF